MSRAAVVSPGGRLPPVAPIMTESVSCRYIGAYTLQTCEKRDACAIATAFSSGSMFRLAFTVVWALTVG